MSYLLFRKHYELQNAYVIIYKERSVESKYSPCFFIWSLFLPLDWVVFSAIFTVYTTRYGDAYIGTHSLLISYLEYKFRHQFYSFWLLTRHKNLVIEKSLFFDQKGSVQEKRLAGLWTPIHRVIPVVQSYTDMGTLWIIIYVGTLWIILLLPAFSISCSVPFWLN